MYIQIPFSNVLVYIKYQKAQKWFKLNCTQYKKEKFHTVFFFHQSPQLCMSHNLKNLIRLGHQTNWLMQSISQPMLCLQGAKNHYAKSLNDRYYMDKPCNNQLIINVRVWGTLHLCLFLQAKHMQSHELNALKWSSICQMKCWAWLTGQ